MARARCKKLNFSQVFTHSILSVDFEVSARKTCCCTSSKLYVRSTPMFFVFFFSFANHTCFDFAKRYRILLHGLVGNFQSRRDERGLGARSPVGSRSPKNTSKIQYLVIARKKKKFSGIQFHFASPVLRRGEETMKIPGKRWNNVTFSRMRAEVGGRRLDIRLTDDRPR